MVVDRIVVRPDVSARLADSFETALQLGDGIAIAEFADQRPQRRLPVTSPLEGEVGAQRREGGKRQAQDSPVHPPPQPSPSRGREKAAASGERRAHHLLGEVRLPGVGLHHRGDRAQAVLVQQSLWRLPGMRRARHRAVLRAGADRAGRESLLARGAIAPWTRTSATSPYYQQTLEALARAYKQKMTTPWKDLPEDFRNVILYGSGEDEINFTYDDSVRKYSTKKPFEGVINNIERRWRETRLGLGDGGAVALSVRAALRGLHRLSAEAAGARGEDRRPPYRPGHRDVDPGGVELVRAAAGQADGEAERDRGANLKRDPRAARLPRTMSGSITSPSPARAGTLSGGESQRIRLASQIGSGLTGVLYVLDEPSIGLHQRDNARLLDTLKSLRDLGNTVLVVEHDEDAILHRRLCRGYGPGRRRAWRRGGGRRHARRGDGQPEQPHRAISHRLQADPDAARAAQADQGQAPLRDRARAPTI